MVIRPEYFGAVGDDVKDDGPALQAALAASWVSHLPLHLYATMYGTKQELEVPHPKHTVTKGTRIIDQKT